MTNKAARDISSSPPKHLSRRDNSRIGQTVRGTEPVTSASSVKHVRSACMQGPIFMSIRHMPEFSQPCLVVFGKWCRSGLVLSHASIGHPAQDTPHRIPTRSLQGPWYSLAKRPNTTRGSCCPMTSSAAFVLSIMGNVDRLP